MIPDANHALETGNVDVDINNLREIMRETERYIRMITVDSTNPMPAEDTADRS